MLEEKMMKEFTEILREELVPAMGCTEPVALAYCAALAREILGEMPTKVDIHVSPNIIKNVRSVIVPNTGGLRGIETAVAAGIVAGDAHAKLQVLSKITEDEIAKIQPYKEATEFALERTDSKFIFHIVIEVTGENHQAVAEIVGHHTNVVRLERDGECVCIEGILDEEGQSASATKLEESDSLGSNQHKTDRAILTVERIVDYANSVDIEEVQDVIMRQVDYNTTIAEEGIRGNYGANIGRILLRAYGDSPHNRAKAYAAAGSDARMNGCELPVVINSGSGNQGITTSIPVYIFAKSMHVSDEEMIRALVVSNLISIHLKTGIGSLSAYCGATSAACGAAAGICHMKGGTYEDIAHTVVNALAIDSGMVCDGAKASCAAKIASAVEAGLLGLKMRENGSEFFGGDGIVEKGVENTIRNIGILASQGMAETDKTIIQMMTEVDRRAAENK
jgi:L-cysteine desulfidase